MSVTESRPAKTGQQLVQEAKARISEITPDGLSQWLNEGRQPGQDFYLLDVREPQEVAIRAIAGAVHIPRGMLEMQVEDALPDRNKPVVAYCAGGNRSALAAATLQEMGYTTVYSLQGGMRTWVDP